MTSDSIRKCRLFGRKIIDEYLDELPKNQQRTPQHCKTRRFVLSKFFRGVYPTFSPHLGAACTSAE